MRKINLAFFSICCFFLASFAVPVFTKAAPPKTDVVEKALGRFAADPDLGSASWGFYALDTRNGQLIASHNENMALIPASAQKVVTTATALALLGNDYRFKTLLQYTGTIKGDTLHGNLYIKGFGDPTLGSTLLDDSLDLEKVLKHWLSDLQSAGISAIEGNIIADGSWFDDHMIPPKWMWEDIGNYYGAGAHALTVHENKYSVYFEPGQREHEPAQVEKTIPEIPQMQFVNQVTTGPRGSGDRVYIYGSPYSNVRWLTGTVPLGESSFRVRGSMPDPGYFLAYRMKEFLAQNQIGVSGQAHTHLSHEAEENDAPKVVISQWESPPLKAIAQRTNYNSVNTYAENLIKTLGREFGEGGSFGAGAAVITEFWANQHIDTQGMRIHDGSGLSAFNTITVKQLCEMLTIVAGNKVLWESLTAGFPVAAQSGSLRNMFHRTPSAGKLMAKSGFLSHVRSYAGYTRCQNGHLIAFAFIVNNYQGTPLEMRGKMEKLMNSLSRLKL